MIKYLLFIIYTIGGICNPLKNIALPKTNREFCLYTSNSILKMFNPFYINNKTKRCILIMWKNMQNLLDPLG